MVFLTFCIAAFLVIFPVHSTMSVYKYPPVITEILIKDKYYTVDYDAAEPGYSVYTASFDGEILGVYNGRIYSLPSSS